MRQTREILRQRLLLHRSYREIGRSLGVSVGAAANAVARAQAQGLDWPAVQVLTDAALEAQLYRRADLPRGDRPIPDCGYLHTELHKVGVTLKLLHLEYLEQHPTTGYRYTQFCDSRSGGLHQRFIGWDRGRRADVTSGSGFGVGVRREIRSGPPELLIQGRCMSAIM
jgi:hypothetical protein